MASIVKNTPVALERTIIVSAFGTDGLPQNASAETWRLSGGGVTARNTLGTFTQLDTGRSAHSYVFTQAESNLFTAGTYGVLSRPSDAPSVQALDFPFFVTAENIGVAAPTTTALADAILDRDMGAGTDSGSSIVRTMRQALRTLRNKMTISGTTATFYKENDVTVSHTATLGGTTPAVTSSDPAGP